MKHLHALFFILNFLFTQSVRSDRNYCAWGVYDRYETGISKLNYTAITANHSLSVGIDDTAIKETGDDQFYLKLPLLPVLFATSSTLPQGKCKWQVRRYLKELNNGTLWAVRMFDSSTKYPEGIIAGHTRHHGNFDECYQIGSVTDKNSLERNTAMIAGKYCLVKITYKNVDVLNDHVGPFTLDFEPDDSVWEAVKETKDFRRIRRNLLEYALCVPDACSASDIEEALEEPLRIIGMEQRMIIKVEVNGNCQTRKESFGFSTLAKIYCCIILGLVLLVGLSTWYDVTLSNDSEREYESLIKDVLLCFSIKRNFLSITTISYSHPGLDGIHLFRFFAMCCAIFYHRMLQYFTNPTINSEYLEYSYTVPYVVLLMNAVIFIESFLTVGGILRAYNMLHELDEKKKMNFFATVLSRYLRFTPLYFVVIAFIALILPHIGSGPYWETKIGLDSRSCAENWWTNILYINNYVNAEKLCMFQSWYITVDFHLYILSSFVIYSFWRMPRKIGYPFLVTIIIIVCVVQFYSSYIYNVQPMLILTHPNMNELKEDLYFTSYYIKTHEHLNTYFIGVLGGAIIHDHRLSPWSISGPWKRFPFIISAFIIGLTSLYMGVKFHNPNVIPTPLENAFYGIFSKLVVAMITVVYIVYMSVSDKSEFLHKISKPRWVQPLAKLTYGAYLIHSIHQSYDIGVTRNARTFSIHNAVRDILVDVVFSFLLAFILTLLIEEPFRRIEKRLVAKESHKLKSGNGMALMLQKKST